MYKFVDKKSVEEKIEGFAYTNCVNSIERVVLDDNSYGGQPLVQIFTDDRTPEHGDDCVAIYTEDIPKLILALQAAYDHQMLIKRLNGK